MGHWLTLCKQHADVQLCIGKQQAENLNGALVNGYANSRQRLNRVLVKGTDVYHTLLFPWIVHAAASRADFMCSSD